MDTLPQIDQIDQDILDRLQAHAKLTNAQLAQYINLSPASTLERVRKLERQGIIKSYHARLDPTKLALQTCVVIQITLHSLTNKNVSAFRACMARIPEVVECYQVVGDIDFLVKVVTADIEAYQNLVMDRLSEVQEIRNIKSFVVTATIKEAGIPVMSLCQSTKIERNNTNSF